MSIELRIERLVIDAALLGGESAADVRAAIEHELAQRLAQPGTAEALRGLGTVNCLPPVPLAAAGHSRPALGMRIAAAVGEGLGAPPAVAPAGRGREARTRP